MRKALIFVALLGCTSVGSRRSIDQPHAFGKVDAPFVESLGVPMIAFAPDGSRAACAIKRGNQEAVRTCPGGDSAAFDHVGWPVFSESGSKVFYLAVKEKKVSIQPSRIPRWHDEIVDVQVVGEEVAYVTSTGELFLGSDLLTRQEAIVGAAFSGNSWACIAVEGGKYFVFNGRRGKEYARVFDLRLDAQTLAYVASDGSRQFVVANDIEGPRFDQVSELQLVGDRVAYFATEGGGTFMMFGGKKGPVFESASELAWSRDGSSHAYIAHQAGTSWIVVNGEKRDRVSTVWGLTFGRESLAYVAQTGDRWRVFVGGRPEPGFKSVASRPIFSTDGSVSYTARDDDGGWYAVVNGKVDGPYDFVGPLRFCEGRPTFGALKGNELLWRVLDVPK